MYIENIEKQTNMFLAQAAINSKPSISEINEYNKQVEIICLSCKESVNRLKLREQGLLVNLVRLQQRIKSNKLEISVGFKYATGSSSLSSSSNSLNHLNSNDQIDHTWYNKLLVALCCFAHDQESLNILLANGLIEALIGYLDESMTITRKNEPTLSKVIPNTTILNSNSTNYGKSTDEKVVFLKDLLFIHSKLTEEKKQTSKKTPTINKKRKLGLDLNASSHNMDDFDASARCLKRSNTSSDSLFRMSPTWPSSPPMAIDTSQSGAYSLQHQMSFSPINESFASMSPTSFSMPSPPQRLTRSSPTFYFLSQSPSASSSSMCSSPTPYLMAMAIQDNQSDDNDTNSNNNMDHLNQIQFSPSIKNDESSCDSDSELDNEETNVENEGLMSTTECLEQSEQTEKETAEQEDTQSQTSETISARKKSLSSSSLASLSTLNIEAINQTEACVFYVLSQLSHNDKPSVYLLNQFEAVIECLLKYLKCAKIKNPRALRILNRLSKNQNCFQSFVMGQFPFKIREILGNNSENSANASNKDTKMEMEVEKEMSVYLSSNKVIILENSMCLFYHQLLSSKLFKKFEGFLRHNLLIVSLIRLDRVSLTE